MEGLAAHGRLPELVVTVVAGRADTANLADVAAVGVAALVDEVMNFEPWPIRYGGQERIAITGRYEQRAMTVVSCRPRQPL